MALLALPSNRFAVFYADKVKATSGLPATDVGSSILLNVGKSGVLTTLGASRFADFPIVRLEVTQLTPKTFVLAGRAVQAVDDTDPSVNQEALALLGEMSGDDLIFDSNMLNFEPKGSQIWARGVSLIAPS